MLEAAEREFGQASRSFFLSFKPGTLLWAWPFSILLSPSCLTANSPQLAAAPCWNPNFLGLENKASREAVPRS